MKPANNLNLLRNVMMQNNIDVVIIPMSDPHLSEYVAEHWRVIKWISGFTGSSGTIVVMLDFAWLWTDSRYFLQAEEQLRGTGIQLMKLQIAHAPEYISWTAENISKCSTIALDGRLFSVSMVKQMELAFLPFNHILKSDFDPIAELWTDRPSIPKGEVFIHDIKFTGKSFDEKLIDLRSYMQFKDLDYQVLSSLDDIAWLFNIRGHDIAFVPLAICFAVISLSDAFLFIDLDKLPESVIKKLKKDFIVIKPYDEVFSFLADIEFGKSLGTQFSKTNFALFNSIPDDCTLTDLLNHTTTLKACKNNTEITNIRQSMVKDGVALVKFFYWLEQGIGKETITEISASDKLRLFRTQQEGFFDESFAPISAYNAHAAMPHYSATAETNVELKPDGIYLIDSGAQYFDGTTDITRSISLGNPTPEQKHDFTIALKGTIDLAMAVFPYGTKGYQLDTVARKPLWDNKMNFGHGTGHGVGYFLNVHEGPQSINSSTSSDVSTILQPGMIISDEPAFYREGEYGFRTENLLLVVEDGESEDGKFLKFETLSLCPIDRNLINWDLVDEKEKSWLDSYHKLVFDELSLSLENDEVEWLKKRTIL